ncbi:MAG: helix-turn-helix domain-containing protein [Xanthobacteraceae bacterium]
MSIKAMTWAFGLPLEPRAKIALLAIADNARDDGVAWPSRDTIAEKSSQSRATVNRRIKTLVALGVIAVFARFREDGTQTSDEIRLDLSVTPEELERRLRDAAAGDHDGESDDDSGDEGGGCQADTLPSHSCSPGVAVVMGGGSHSCNPHNEPSDEPDSPPNPPPGGSAPEDLDGKEPEHFATFFESCQHWRTMDRGKALAVFRLMDEREQAKAAAASPLHAAECDKARRRSKDAHKLLGEKFWERYPNARLPEKLPDRVWISAADLGGLRVALSMLDRAPPALIDDPARGRGAWRLTPIPPDLAAMASFSGQDPEAWELVDKDSHEFAAWRTRLREWTGFTVEPQRRWLEPYNDAVHSLSPSHPDFRLRRCAHGLPVPCRWPPRKDGTFCNDGDAGGEVTR